jgi:hypothetical protein
LPRPLVIVGGWHDPGVAAIIMRRTIEALIQDDRIVTVSMGFVYGFDQGRDRLIQALEAAVPSDSETQTVEVDVLAFSMGGLVARHAASPAEPTEGGPGHKRLNLRRLFTIGSPHQGSPLAQWALVGPMERAMRPGSAFLRRLNQPARLAGYELYPYVRLGDWVVGTTNAAPPGRIPWWVDPPFLSSTHGGAVWDPRFYADILRRLRGEPPWTSRPAAQPPN